MAEEEIDPIESELEVTEKIQMDALVDPWDDNKKNI
jgi:hypothetical protein